MRLTVTLPRSYEVQTQNYLKGRMIYGSLEYILIVWSLLVTTRPWSVSWDTFFVMAIHLEIVLPIVCGHWTRCVPQFLGRSTATQAWGSKVKIIHIVCYSIILLSYLPTLHACFVSFLCFLFSFFLSFRWCLGFASLFSFLLFAVCNISQVARRLPASPRLLHSHFPGLGLVQEKSVSLRSSPSFFARRVFVFGPWRRRSCPLSPKLIVFPLVHPTHGYY